MLLAALVIGALTAYYFGVRWGAYAAVAAFVLYLVAFFVPSLRLPIWAFVGAGAFAVWRIGSKRPRPPDAVLAVHLVKRTARRAWTALTGGRGDSR
jgi:hypothetical protein